MVGDTQTLVVNCTCTTLELLTKLHVNKVFIVFFVNLKGCQNWFFFFIKSCQYSMFANCCWNFS